jgi:hypothetical protein
MIHTLKLILVVILSIFFAFGLWYVIFFFLTVEANPMKWHWITKFIYLYIGFASTAGIVQETYK